MKRLKEKEELKRLSVNERNDFVADELQRLISEMTELREENRLSQNQVSETLGLQSHGNLLFFYLSNAGSIGPYLISGCCSNIHCLKLLESPSVKESLSSITPSI